MNRLVIIKRDKSQHIVRFSPEDWDWISGINWHVTNIGYAVTNCRVHEPRMLLLHRIILNAPKDMQVDHINGNRLDNRRENLRLCTHQQNCMNRKPVTPGYKGVSWAKGKWRAQIRYQGYTHYLGNNFDAPEEAAQAYDEKAKELFGEFARLNSEERA